MTDQLDLATVLKLLQQLQAQAAKPQGFAKAKSSLAKKDAQILKGFARKGIKDVVLMDRSDRSKPFNVKPFKAWVAEGRVVRKGQHGVNGLFHVSQTDKIVQSETATDVTQVDQSKINLSKLATKFKLAKTDNQPTA